jgi:hypothetical protein
VDPNVMQMLFYVHQHQLSHHAKQDTISTLMEIHVYNAQLESKLVQQLLLVLQVHVQVVFI